MDFNELQGDSLNAHATPLEDGDLISGRSVLYSSVTPVEDLEDVTFSIPPDPECAFVLNQSRLEGHFVVATDDDKGVGPTDTTAIANHYCAALFSQIEVHLNGTQVCDLSAPLSYPFKHHIDFLLSYDNNVKANVGRAEGFCRTHLSRCYAKTAPSGKWALCQDMEENRLKIMGGKKVYFCSTVGADIFHTDKYLPPNVEISVVLRRFNPCFGLLQNNPDKVYRIRLKELKLRMRKVLPCERVRNRLNTELLKCRPFFLPFKDTQMKQYLIPAGSLGFSANHINNSELLPQQIIFCMTRSDVFAKGPNVAFPFHFKHCDLRSVILKNNGRPLMPRPIECEIESGDYMELYDHFQSNVGGRNRISTLAFTDGQMFLAFDLTPDKCLSFHNHVGVPGNLEIDLTFGRPTKTPTTLISYAIYNAAISIDSSLQVTKVKY